MSDEEKGTKKAFSLTEDVLVEFRIYFPTNSIFHTDISPFIFTKDVLGSVS